MSFDQDKVHRRTQQFISHMNPSNEKPIPSKFSPTVSRNDTCGIIAVISKNESAVEYLIEGLTILQNRGYDSAGVCTLNAQNELVTSKYASEKTTSDAIKKLEKHSSHHKGHTIGIAHTRWATVILSPYLYDSMVERQMLMHIRIWTTRNVLR
jgi:hypothetical protein